MKLLEITVIPLCWFPVMSYSPVMSEDGLEQAKETVAEKASRDERRVRAAQDVLRTAIRDLYLGHFGASGNIPPELDLHLHLKVRPRDNWELTFAPPLLDQLFPQLADAEAAREVFAVGHVYCFRCESCSCEHSAPSQALQVFRGYDATGRPEWHELAQALIDDKVERIELLYQAPPRVVAHFQPGRQLKGRQLTAFGKSSLSYSILAQVIAGYFDLRGERAAITLQVVEGRGRDGQMRLRLNPVFYSATESYLMEWLAAGRNAALFRAIQIAERELAGLEQKVVAARSRRDQEAANQWMGRIPAIMRRLVEAIERGGRQEHRRTRHVETRREDQRPVHKAMEDVARARAEQCYYDEKARTYVVVADRGRAHAFNAAGRHVTSFSIKPSAVSFRVRTERWRPVTSAEWAEFRPGLHPREPSVEKERHEA